ncbi:hypothetical protein [Lutibacter sp. Hel_I_33_5]|uniref:hypothetical protein n=1 Tax=Lutibacter sp. Hel_I_33_5 TaxID=1566289 RepID=UPI0011A6C177|nr:hypothetical protein [Lutibacter sp. Hel_I_33_5]
MLTTHHFGMFSSRINHNFKEIAPKRSTLSFNYETGNSFHPFVEGYYPKDPNIRKHLSQVIWHDRRFNFIDQQTTPAEYTNIIIDAVFKSFRVDFNTALSENHELGISLRSYLATKGNYPFTFFMSDESIEWFHSNVAGGEDPFGRRYYGLNQVNIKYTDRNGNVLELNEGDFFGLGIEFNHFYYPTFINKNKKDIRVNFGSHLGINTSKFNPSIDIGISANGIKKWTLKNNNEFRFALGGSILRKNLINFKTVIDLGNRPYLFTIEPQIEYTKYTRKNNYHSFGVHFQLQTSYNKASERDYYFLVGKWQEIHSGWQNGVEKLHEGLQVWTFLYTYGRENFTLSLFLKEDLFLNNAPDGQTGISLKIPIFKN